MSIRIDSPLIPGAVHIGFTGLGVLGSQIASSGSDGPGFGYPSVDVVDADAELWFEILTQPTGTLVAQEDTSFTYDGAVSSFTFRKWRDGVDQGTATAQLNAGVAAPVNTVSKTFPLTYDVAKALVSGTAGGAFPLTYDVAAAFVAGQVARAFPINYDVAAVAYYPVTQTFALSYDVAKAIAQGTASTSFALSYDVAKAVVSSAMEPRTFVLMYNVQAAEVPEEDIPEPITLEQAKQHLRVVFSDEDDYIAGLIEAAREMAEDRTNRTIRRRRREVAFSSWDASMVLPKPPFVSLDSVDYIDRDGGLQNLAPEEYIVDTYTEPAQVEFTYGFAAPLLHARRRPIVVRYTAGYAPGKVPRPIIQWMLLAIGTMYEHRESIAAGVQLVALPDDFMQALIQPYVVYE